MARREGTVYKRHSRWWIGWRDAAGKQHCRSCGEGVKTKDQAEAVLKATLAKVKAGIDFGGTEEGVVTVAQFATRWLQKRKAIGLVSEEGRLKKHVLSRIGTIPIDEVQARHIHELITGLRSAGKLAPKSVHNVYGLMQALFRDAEVQGLIARSPCILRKAHLGTKEDKDPEWRAKAVFSREELIALISAPDLPWDRQVLYALQGLAGLRHGEAAGLRWKDLDTTTKPLFRLFVVRQYENKPLKTKQPRMVPVHPTLAAMLREWREKGWAEMLGRNPGAEDFIIPSREGEVRSRHHSRNKLLEDLDRLGLRSRRGHDLRRTFISLARTDGARPDILKRVTHTPGTDILDVYTTLEFPALCAEVVKLQIERPAGVVPTLETRWRTEPKRDEALPNKGESLGASTTVLTTGAGTLTEAGRKAAENSQIQAPSLVEAPGIEPGSEKAPILADPCSVDVLFTAAGAHRHAPDRRSPALSYAWSPDASTRVAG